MTSSTATWSIFTWSTGKSSITDWSNNHFVYNLFCLILILSNSHFVHNPYGLIPNSSNKHLVYQAINLIAKSSILTWSTCHVVLYSFRLLPLNLFPTYIQAISSTSTLSSYHIVQTPIRLIFNWSIPKWSTPNWSTPNWSTHNWSTPNWSTPNCIVVQFLKIFVAKRVISIFVNLRYLRLTLMTLQSGQEKTERDTSHNMWMQKLVYQCMRLLLLSKMIPRSAILVL